MDYSNLLLELQGEQKERFSGFILELSARMADQGKKNGVPKLAKAVGCSYQAIATWSSQNFRQLPGAVYLYKFCGISVKLQMDMSFNTIDELLEYVYEGTLNTNYVDPLDQITRLIPQMDAKKLKKLSDAMWEHVVTTK